MLPTLFGLLTFALALVVLARGTALDLLRTVMLLSLMGGSAAIVLRALGGSTVAPAILALPFLFLRCALPGTGLAPQLRRASNDLAWLVLFTLYGVAGAMILPRLFAGAISVTPLRPIPNGYLYAAYPLSFSSQNITTSVYLLTTLLAALCTHIASQTPGSERPLARTASVVAGLHALLGVASVVLTNTPAAEVFDFFRNGFYAQLDQTVEGYVRMSGIWPEPAVYAAYGFGWLVFVTELWLRDVERRWTGTGGALLGAALLLSTSTTAYVGIAAYGAILTLRIAFLPGSVPLRKGLAFFALALLFAALLLGLMITSRSAAHALSRFVAHFTTDKLTSGSALQRAFWARQGLEAFRVSHGLGLGSGSFRSSSIATAVLGSTGLIGTLALVTHLARVFKPLYRSTWTKVSGPRMATGVAASWAAAVALIPACFSAATPDPGFVWGIFCGVALALRPLARPDPRPGAEPALLLHAPALARSA